MNIDNIRQQIKQALSGVSKADFVAATTELLAVLGYKSNRLLELSGDVDEFIDEFSGRKNTRTEKTFFQNVRSARAAFQLTSEEISVTNQASFFDPSDTFDKGKQRSFIFFAVELKGQSYPRGRYAEFTREINKRVSQPSVVLFKTASGLLTLSFVNRREHKRDSDRDVLGHVSLIREIDPASPHRAHLDILATLALPACLQWMDAHNKSHDFDGLLAAWLYKLDTRELNRRFYGELFVWFKKAVAEAKFPSTVPAEQQVIRLITRILFIWFIKEKDMVREEWFVPAEMKKLLHNFGGSDYYRAVLQNLFFATLNTEMGMRGFSSQTESGHRVFSDYRYQSLIRDTERFQYLMQQTPFINGGLFDCLDDLKSRSAGGKRIDMFSDPDPDDGPLVAQARRDAWRELDVPDALFFDSDHGLFPLLDHYKFTVEENTPIEQEVALDPELLGKVFENLLAAYNPETRENVRKSTGSYYTPRMVVDYMVDEALVAALTEKARPADGDTEYWQERLRYLLDYEDAFADANELFEEAETESIVRAIAEIKVLDPAVGSGAFPMGILHKLTLALQRLDPDNQRWQALQKERTTQRTDATFETRNRQERDAELLEISKTFERYSGDFGRKLYLIQNSIFGVDIQPVACQIAKLRFFISLAIEQQIDKNAANFGIKPLPNLETRFVAADTLLGLDRPAQLDLGYTTEVNKLERELRENREKHFHATTRQQKLDCREKDTELRKKLSTELKKAGLKADTADKVSSWNPYDQNAFADWFDAEYMFGVADGFDVVIGNPPYIQLQANKGELGKKYQNSGYEVFIHTGDIYQLFYERGCQLLKPRHGFLSYITSNKWMRSNYGKKQRSFLAEKTNPVRLLDFGGFQVFESATVDTNILLTKNVKGSGRLFAIKFRDDFSHGDDINKYTGNNAVEINIDSNTWTIASKLEISLKEKIERIGIPLKEWDIAINYGITA